MTISRIYWQFVAAASLIVSPPSSEAALFTTNLQLTTAQSELGPYLTGSYSFGTPFARVRSVTVEFTAIHGYQGNAVTTGNSSWWQALAIEVHAVNEPPPADYWFNSLVNSTMTVRPNSRVESRFTLLQGDEGPFVLGYLTPDFVKSGAGAVSIMDAHTYSWHPLPDFEGAYSTTSWLLPVGIEGVTITIDATPVPEAASASLALMGLGIATVLRREGSRRRKFAG